MSRETNLCLSVHDELYLIDLNRVLYLQADDHYTDVYYTSGAHFLVPFGLIKIEDRIATMSEAKLYMLRLGRKYIVNTKHIFRINTTKELLYMTNDDGSSTSLHGEDSYGEYPRARFRGASRHPVSAIRRA